MAWVTAIFETVWTVIAWFQAHSAQISVILGLIGAWLSKPDVQAELEKLLGVDLPNNPPTPISSLKTDTSHTHNFTGPTAPLKAILAMNPISLIEAKVKHLLAGRGDVPPEALAQIHAAVAAEAPTGAGLSGFLDLVRWLLANSDKIKEIIDSIIVLFPKTPAV